jgi:zinc protease
MLLGSELRGDRAAERVTEAGDSTRRHLQDLGNEARRSSGVTCSREVGRPAREPGVPAQLREEDRDGCHSVRGRCPGNEVVSEIRVPVKGDQQPLGTRLVSDEVAEKLDVVFCSVRDVPHTVSDVESLAAKHSRRLEDDVLLSSPQETKNHEIDDHRRQRDVQEHVRRLRRWVVELRRVPEDYRGVQFTRMRIPIETFQLPNGLFVTLSEDHTAPIVAVNLWYHVGSANEREGRTGFAHLFEHMLFQGSADVAANEHFELIQRAGGTLNGSTWLDRTNYFETVPSHQLELVLWLEGNRMGWLLPAMTQQKLDTQRDVVKNERRWSVDNQPYGTWWERLPALAFPKDHPFHHSLIGSMSDLDAASLEDIKHFFATYYTPDNAVLSIAGDFDPAEARSLVTKYFGAIPPGKGKPPLPDMSLPAKFGHWKRVVVEDDVMLPRLFLAFRSPVFGSAEYYPASVTAAILGSRKGSRLYRRLVRERQVAAEAQAFTYDLTKGSDLLVLDVTARPGVAPEAMEGEVADEVDLLVRDGITDEEVARAVALIQTDFVAAMQSAGERADRLSLFATYFKNPELVNDQVQRYEAVTAADVNRFARERLSEENRASLLFLPRRELADEAGHPEGQRIRAEEMTAGVGAEARQ